MNKILIALLAVIYVSNVRAQTKEMVYKVDGDMVSNSSGTFFRPAAYIFAPVDRPYEKYPVVGNFRWLNRPGNGYFFVYSTDDIDVMFKAKDAEIAELKKQLIDLKNAMSNFKNDLIKLKTQVKTK